MQIFYGGACEARSRGKIHRDGKEKHPAIAEEMLWADCITLATPIFAWYCTAKMKAVLDRHYGFNKYYGSAEGCLWEGKKVGIIATHGYDGAYATDPFEMGVYHTWIESWTLGDWIILYSFIYWPTYVLRILLIVAGIVLRKKKQDKKYVRVKKIKFRSSRPYCRN